MNDRSRSSSGRHQPAPPTTYEPDWVATLRELQAMAQTGLTYSQDPYDIARYERLREIAAGMIAQGFALDPALTLKSMESYLGYATPQVDVRGAVFCDDRVLLVRERADGLWALPGGWADVNISAADNVAKEIEEETHVMVKVIKLSGVYDRRLHPYDPPEPRHCYKFYFVCEHVAGEPAAGDDTTAAGFFPLDKLPDLSLGRVIEPHIRRAYDHFLDPGLPTDFD